MIVMRKGNARRRWTHDRHEEGECEEEVDPELDDANSRVVGCNEGRGRKANHHQAHVAAEAVDWVTILEGRCLEVELPEPEVPVLCGEHDPQRQIHEASDVIQVKKARSAPAGCRFSTSGRTSWCAP